MACGNGSRGLWLSMSTTQGHCGASILIIHPGTWFLCISCMSDVSPIMVPHVIGGIMNEGVSIEPKRTLRSVSLMRGASQTIRNEGGIGIMESWTSPIHTFWQGVWMQRWCGRSEKKGLARVKHERGGGEQQESSKCGR